jgi:hypothetical protein
MTHSDVQSKPNFGSVRAENNKLIESASAQ